MRTTAVSPIDDLDRPRSIPELAAWLHDHGETVSASWLWRRVRDGSLPHARAGRITSTARAYYAMRSPQAGAA